ncbi:MAG: site-2 protease family protein [Gemmataceae bacterium]|nr:site-2 protease family protein [Gemmataceae bacterium]
MRDPLSWGIPLFRLLGVRVKIHVLFLLIAGGLILRMALAEGQAIAWTDLLLFWGLVLFGVVLIHEYGHVVAARAVGGEAQEVVLWPLGGFAAVDVPRRPRAYFVAAAGGPIANLGLCLLTALLLLAGGFWPDLNPFTHPFTAELKNYRDGRLYTSYYGQRYHLLPDPTAMDTNRSGAGEASGTPDGSRAIPTWRQSSRGLAPTWVTWTYRTFYLSWILLLFNLIPAYPLDGGRMFQSLVWAYRDYPRSVTLAAYSGWLFGGLFLVAAIALNESLLLGLSLFMFLEAWRLVYTWESEERGPFGYDFSAGYSSLEEGEEIEEDRPVRKSWWQRWREARQARQREREMEQRARDEARMDALLDKIARYGKDSLTEEERRFLERMSARKRNMS